MLNVQSPKDKKERRSADHTKPLSTRTDQDGGALTRDGKVYKIQQEVQMRNLNCVSLCFTSGCTAPCDCWWYCFIVLCLCIFRKCAEIQTK